MTSLYAGEIAINHIYSSTLDRQHQSPVIDVPSASEDSIWKAWHIHCLHNPEYFAKFRHRDELREFLKNSQNDRIQQMVKAISNSTALFKVVKEFKKIKIDYDITSGKVTVRDYVRALAWRKAYAATGAINLD